MMGSRRFLAGDWVIYRKPKHSTKPGPRARDIKPTRYGEDYTYFVTKFWIVEDVLEDGRLRVRTRRGKTHLLDAADRNLRRVPRWQRWLYRKWF